MNQVVARGAETFAPLTAIVYHILLAIGNGRLHGYAIAQKIAELDPSLSLGPGTLYGSIKRMLDDDLLEEVKSSDDDQSGSNRRRYYQLTNWGREAAQAEKTRLWRLTEAAQAVDFSVPSNTASTGSS